MFGGKLSNADYSIGMFFDKRIIFYLVVGILICGPFQAIPKFKKYLFNEEKIYILDIFVMTFLLFICTMVLVNNTYNPFIYFRF
jgi:alginate O-acetyltransferase complex protein AlgI